MRRLFAQAGMRDTCLDENGPIIANRGRQYERDASGRLRNAPPVNNSCKWAGGGLLSTVLDLCTMGNVLLHAAGHLSGTPGSSSILSPAGVEAMWASFEPSARSSWTGRGYGLGWVVQPERAEFGGHGGRLPLTWSHTGGAAGGSSVLLLLPGPRPVAVAILANIGGVDLEPLARELARHFAAQASNK